MRVMVHSVATKSFLQPTTSAQVSFVQLYAGKVCTNLPAASSKVQKNYTYERPSGRTAMHSYCTRNTSCVGSDVRISSWSVWGWQLCRQAECRRRQRFCFTSNAPITVMSHLLRFAVGGDYEGVWTQQHALWEGHLPYMGNFTRKRLPL